MNRSDKQSTKYTNETTKMNITSKISGSKLLTLLVVVAITITGIGGAAAAVTTLEDQRITTTEETTSIWAEVEFDDANATADNSTADVTVYNVTTDENGNESETEFANATVSYDGSETTYLEEFDVSGEEPGDYRVTVEGEDVEIASTSTGTFAKFVSGGASSGDGSSDLGLGFLNDEIHGVPIGFGLGALAVIGGLYKYGEGR